MIRASLLASALLLLPGCFRPDDVDDDTGSSGRPGDGGSSTDGGTDGGGTDGGGGDGGGTDGGGTDGGGDGGGGDCSGLSIVGDWVSAGDDLSPLFQSVTFDYVEVQATFSGDCSYAVTARDGSGSTYDLDGTWSATGGSPGSITQQQAQPYEATAEGIWQVDGGVLTFEVVQTLPDYGFTPPTPGTGFGSTAGQGLSPGDNTQVYRRP
ncbi:MAG: hypothetical protein H6742_07780 [Alphaproteobacteria bacterium]|nr:hypothetical protein [Alphaproteobacteria bacterium]